MPRRATTAILSPAMRPVVRSLARPGTLVVLDFDGTLAPIVSDRRAARLSRTTRALLARLARLYPVAVLSGRAADDVRARLDGVPVRWVVGSHGAEWPGEERRHRAWRGQIGRWRARLSSRLAGVPGLELERTPLSLAVHYRHAADPRAALAAVQAATADLPACSLVLGKMVVNLVPEGAGDKGTALRRLVRLADAERVLFVGDDVTDEAAFGARLDVPAVMVRVGRSAGSKAGSWVRRRDEVDVLLDRLCRLREVGPLGATLGFLKELWALEQGLNRRSRAMLRRHGVSGPQRLAVRLIGRLAPIRPAQLARELHLHPSSITRLIRRLERRGLVRRTTDPSHRGRYLLEPGRKGGRVERLGAGTVESAVLTALEAAGAEDVAAARRVLWLVTKGLATPR